MAESHYGPCRPFRAPQPNGRKCGKQVNAKRNNEEWACKKAKSIVRLRIRPCLSATTVRRRVNLLLNLSNRRKYTLTSLT